MDGMASLRQKLRDCDALIAATPVYMCSVSGWCKNFLDRCARWCHVFELLGKPCLTLSVTGLTGAERACDYLSECLEVMGCCVASRLPLQRQGEGLVVGSEQARTALEQAAGKLLDAVARPESYLSEHAEAHFLALQQSYRSLETFRTLMGRRCPDEVNTFRQRGLMNCASLREAMKLKGGAAT
jgi:multimeric flavodoxin WrbA